LQYNITNCKGNVKKVRNTRKCQKMLENAWKSLKMQFYREHQMELKETNFVVS
jgi:hypothetical protein